MPPKNENNKSAYKSKLKSDLDNLEMVRFKPLKLILPKLG